MARTKRGYVEYRSAEVILAQFRNCVQGSEEAADADEWDLVRMHLRNAADSATDLDNLLSDNKTAPLPADWQRESPKEK